MNQYEDDLREETRYERIQRRTPRFTYARQHHRSGWQGVHRRHRAHWCQHTSGPKIRNEQR